MKKNTGAGQLRKLPHLEPPVNLLLNSFGYFDKAISHTLRRIPVRDESEPNKLYVSARAYEPGFDLYVIDPTQEWTGF